MDVINYKTKVGVRRIPISGHVKDTLKMIDEH